VPFSYYILAAGRGRRAGGPKAWRLHEGRSLLAHHVAFVTRQASPENVAISIQAEWLERCRALHAHIRWVPTDPDAQPIASLQRLTQVLPLTRWSFVYHVDMPLWRSTVFDVLGNAASDAGAAEALVPTCDDRGGHPIVLAASLATPLASLDPKSDRLDHWLRSRRTLRVPINERVVLENWNKPTE
jgi:CTP:molybdopterin cytidylyltransferase MocA